MLLGDHLVDIGVNLFVCHEPPSSWSGNAPTSNATTRCSRARSLG
jgi:hypothetical protein